MAAAAITGAALLSLKPAEIKAEKPVIIIIPYIELPEPIIEQEVTYSPNSAEVEIIAKMLWGEARGIGSDMQIAACAWVAVNRVEAGGYSQTIEDVITAEDQFVGYSADNPITGYLKWLAADVLTRWHNEINGQADVGRVIPSDYLWFSAVGGVNKFRSGYESTDYWDWTMKNPYES